MSKKDETPKKKKPANKKQPVRTKINQNLKHMNEMFADELMVEVREKHPMPEEFKQVKQSIMRAVSTEDNLSEEAIELIGGAMKLYFYGGVAFGFKEAAEELMESDGLAGLKEVLDDILSKKDVPPKDKDSEQRHPKSVYKRFFGDKSKNSKEEDVITFND